MTRICLAGMLALMSAVPLVSPAFARSTHNYPQELTVTPAMMAAINTIVSEHARMHRMHRH